MSAPPAPAPRRLALTVWGSALVAYVVAVAGRTSFGVAGLEAVERFGVSAAVLSLFVVVQLAVYAAAQVPVGIVLDRVGSRWVILAGAFILAAGQLMLALVEDLPLALAARVLIGLGDATAFVAVLRLIPTWFPVRQVPVITQLTSIIGQFGQVISAVPFLAVLHVHGWTPAFVSLAATGVLAGLLVAAAVRDRPSDALPLAAAGRRAAGAVRARRSGPDRAVRAPAPASRASLRAAFGEPGTWLGFFTHFLGLFPLNTFTLLWGVPFMVAGQGYNPAMASAMLTAITLVGVVVGPAVGALVALYPRRRSQLVLGSVGVVVLAWASLLLPATPRPPAHMLLVVVALAVSGVSANIGFDFARTFVPATRLGSAIGLVNVGGFVASLLSVFLVGLVLDLVRPSGDYQLADFRLAFATMGIVWAVGVIGVLVTRGAARRRAGTLPPPGG